MQLSLKKRTKGQLELGIIFGGIALIALCIARFLPVLSVLPECVFKGLTGFPCLTCGSSHSIVYLAHGDILSSFAMNPLVAISFLFAVLFFLYSVITLMFDIPRISIQLTEREKDIARVLAVLLLVVNWIYLLMTPDHI